jgi:hypothetical protein
LHLSGEIPSEIGQLENLEILGLNWNQLEGAKGAKVFAKHTTTNCFHMTSGRNLAERNWELAEAGKAAIV